tara:strand:+ start:3076 stop:3930 length:855 start_codon:yes stop_codon:yes gene_type:complete
MVRRAFAELVGTLPAHPEQQAQGHTTNPGFRLGDIDYLSNLWDQGGYQDGLVHQGSQVPWQEPWKSGTNRGDNWLSRGFLDVEGTFGQAQYKAAIDQGYTAPQIYQAMPGAIGGRFSQHKGLRKISEDLRGPEGQFYKDLMRDRGTWLTGYQNVGGTFGEKSYDEVRKLAAADRRIGVPGTIESEGEKITPRTIWGAREGVNRIGPEARRLLLEDLQQGIPLRHDSANIKGPSTSTPTRLPNQGYNVGKSATGMRRQSPKAMTNRNAKGTWGRGSQFFKDASTY